MTRPPTRSLRVVRSDFDKGVAATRDVRTAIKPLSPALAAAVLSEVLRDVAAVAYTTRSKR